MFDITPDEIAELNDADLRALVGLLCEAELEQRGLSPAAVTYGGNQDAPDGGIDVRVTLPIGTEISGFVPRYSTGFQVKKPDMPKGAILGEMRPGGIIRPSIQDLANAAGAYVIVSSGASTADTALQERRTDGMREALADIENPDQLETDFYDRTRLATWVRRHPGYIAWVKEKICAALSGWRPYGAWSGGAESINAEYLVDDELRIHFDQRSDPRSVLGAIDELRGILSQPGKVLRLVGLSGVGKTRLVQALFDNRIGERPLPPSLAVYTNMNDNPDPQPTGLASDLMAKGARAILIIDNCTPDLHRRLTELCRGGRSTLSVLTVEYDVRDDHPEGTEVIRLDTSSTGLITTLIHRQYPQLSEVDAGTIAEASGGNFRIAIVLAETVGPTETIAGLSDEELFDRLFRQRQDANGALLQAAEVCSLVYSFNGEALTGCDAELPRLALLIDQSPREVFRHVSELSRRDLVQQRGVWRAVLPHAIANRLATRALEDIPYDFIHEQILASGNERLARSFAHRLMFLHDRPEAISIVERWLAPEGLLGGVANLNKTGRAMFEYVSPVCPARALEALERVAVSNPDEAPRVWQRHMALLRSLAYDPDLFERSLRLVECVALDRGNEQSSKEAAATFVGLFALYLSGTHATVEQRLAVIERLLRSSDEGACTLGLSALDALLEATHFSSGFQFEFGARSRDYGYEPRSVEEASHWYAAALEMIERLALDEALHADQLRDVFAGKLRGLWSSACPPDDLERTVRRFSGSGFWREGWLACREPIRYDSDQMPPEMITRLANLEEFLRPSTLADRVRAVVLGEFHGFDAADSESDEDGNRWERLARTALELGTLVVGDQQLFDELLPELLQGGNRIWPFGRGMGEAASDPVHVWQRMLEQLERIPEGEGDLRILMGFLVGLRAKNSEFVDTLLDEAIGHPILTPQLPALHMAIQLDDRGAERLTRVLNSGQVPVQNFEALAGGRAVDQLDGRTLGGFLRLLADQPEGWDVALHILHMRFFADTSDSRQHDPELISAGQDLLRQAVFDRNQGQRDYRVAEVANACLQDASCGPLAGDVARRLRQSVVEYATFSTQHMGQIEALLETHPIPVLDALFSGTDVEKRAGQMLFREVGRNRRNPAAVIPLPVLIEWCDADPAGRCPIAASIVPFIQPSEDPEIPPAWTEQAQALISCAPDPQPVLLAFVARFSPTSWSGSRAAIMETNAQLLDQLALLVAPDFLPVVIEMKAGLAGDIERERRREAERDRERHERFE